MDEIGQLLRDARERLGFTLEEVEKATRIRAERLEALENGQMEQLPSEAQARGFLKNYAGFLGLDSDEILDQYDEQRGRGRRGILPKRAEPERQTSPMFVNVRRRRLISSDLIVTAVVTVGVVMVLIWGGGRVFASINQRASATEHASAVDEPTLEPTSTAFGVIAQDVNAMQVTQIVANAPTATLPLRLGTAEEVSLELIGEQQAWIKVTADGDDAFQGRLHKGERKSFTAADRIVVNTGNGGGVRVIYNGTDQGLMGEIGRVIIRVWTREGAQTPTPTATYTPTISPIPSRTPFPSPTGINRSGN
jgi:cytoskeletal protein RodZ